MKRLIKYIKENDIAMIAKKAKITLTLKMMIGINSISFKFIHIFLIWSCNLLFLTIQTTLN